MKLTILAVFALATVAYGLVLPPEQDNGNIVDKLITKALEYLRTILKEQHTFKFPEIPEFTFTVDAVGMDLTVKFDEASISKADDFVIKKLANNIPTLSGEFELLLPTPNLAGNFRIDGKLLNKKVKGSGTFSIDLANMDQNGKFSMGVKDHGLFIDSLSLNYSLDGAKFQVTGMEIEGITQDELQKFLDEQLVDALNKNKDEVCKNVAEQVQEKLNKQVAGKSLTDLIEWLKTLVPQ